MDKCTLKNLSFSLYLELYSTDCLDKFLNFLDTMLSRLYAICESLEIDDEDEDFDHSDLVIEI